MKLQSRSKIISIVMELLSAKSVQIDQIKKRALIRMISVRKC